MITKLSETISGIANFAADGANFSLRQASIIAKIGRAAVGFAAVRPDEDPAEQLRQWSEMIQSKNPLLWVQAHAELLTFIRGLILRRDADLNITRELQGSGLDNMTKVNNRQVFSRHLAKEAETHEDDRKNSVLLMMDLVDFGNINNQIGQLGGDDALRSFAKSLKENFRVNDNRRHDTIYSSEEDIQDISRLGGDEFAVIMELGNVKFDEAMLDTLCINKAIGILSNHNVVNFMEKNNVKTMGVRVGASLIDTDARSVYKSADHKTHTRCKVIIKKDNSHRYCCYLALDKTDPYVNSKMIGYHDVEEDSESYYLKLTSTLKK